MAIATGFAAVILVTLIGNLVDFGKVLKAWPEEIRPDFGGWTWDPSRALGGSTITEFPYFTGLYADLHAHGINVPITMIVLSICISLARDPYLTQLAIVRRRINKDLLGLLVKLGVLAIALGSVATTNSWDLAEYVAFLGLGVFMSLLMIKPFLLRAGLTVAITGAIGAATYIAFFPFYKYYVALFTSVGETRDKTEVIAFANHFGGLLAIVGVGLIAMLVSLLNRRITWFVIDPILPLTFVVVALALAIATNFDLDANSWTIKLAVIVLCAVMLMPIFLVIDERAEDWLQDFAKGVVITVLVVVAVMTADGRGVLALMVTFFVTGGALWMFAEDRGERFVGGIVACATGIVGAIEIVYLQDNLAGGDAYRMNTVFKFYNQVWVLLGIAGAVAIGKGMQYSGLLGWITGESTRDWPDDDDDEFLEAVDRDEPEDAWMSRYQDDGGFPVEALPRPDMATEPIVSAEFEPDEDKPVSSPYPPVQGGDHDDDDEDDDDDFDDDWDDGQDDVDEIEDGRRRRR